MLRFTQSALMRSVLMFLQAMLKLKHGRFDAMPTLRVIRNFSRAMLVMLLHASLILGFWVLVVRVFLQARLMLLQAPFLLALILFRLPMI